LVAGAVHDGQPDARWHADGAGRQRRRHLRLHEPPRGRHRDRDDRVQDELHARGPGGGGDRELAPAAPRTDVDRGRDRIAPRGRQAGGQGHADSGVPLPAVVTGRPGSAYREWAAPASLRASLACLWTRTAPDESPGPTLILPDGCVDLVWWRGQGAFVAGP